MIYRKRYAIVLSLLLSVLVNLNLMGGTPILGESVLDANQLWEFVRKNNPDFPRELANHYIEVGKVYGIRGDMALCQAIIETGWFKFADGTAVKPHQHNYCGLGVVKRGSKGLSFKSAREGVTAQMQHLYAYASKHPLPSGERKVDKRFELVSRGSSTTWEELSGRWASNPRYGDQILALYGQMTASVNKSFPTEIAEEGEAEFFVHRKYKNGNDRRKKKRGSPETESIVEVKDETLSPRLGTVGPVTARYLGLDLSTYMREGIVEANADVEPVTDISERTVNVKRSGGTPSDKNKKDKKSKKQKKDNNKGRKLPKNAIFATPAASGESTPQVDNDGTGKDYVETLASLSNTNRADESSCFQQGVTAGGQNGDTVSVMKNMNRTIKIIRRR